MSSKESYSRTPRYPYVLGLLLVGVGTLCGLGIARSRPLSKIQGHEGNRRTEGIEVRFSRPLAAQAAPLVILTASCPAGTVGIPYQCQLQASGGTPPYTWSIVSGALPPGLALDAMTGLITGTPEAPFPPMNPSLLMAYQGEQK